MGYSDRVGGRSNPYERVDYEAQKKKVVPDEANVGVFVDDDGCEETTICPKKCGSPECAALKDALKREREQRLEAEDCREIWRACYLKINAEAADLGVDISDLKFEARKYQSEKAKLEARIKDLAKQLTRHVLIVIAKMKKKSRKNAAFESRATNVSKIPEGVGERRGETTPHSRDLEEDLSFEKISGRSERGGKEESV